MFNSITTADILPEEKPAWQSAEPIREIPHKCPVCDGCGMVPVGFYGGYGATTSVTPETCRTCNGKGVTWG